MINDYVILKNIFKPTIKDIVKNILEERKSRPEFLKNNQWT